MKNTKFYFASLWISVIMMIVFIFQMFIPNYTSLFILNSLALKWEWWRFITSIFLHGSASHLLYNLFALVLFGFILEKIVGTRNFLIIFFCSGILANIVSVFFYPSSLGASGAIYGILGSLAILRPKMFVWVFGIILPMWLALVVWIIGDLIGLFIPDNIGHIAHLSGIFFGIIFGLFLYREYKEFKKKDSIKIDEHKMNQWEERYMR